MVELLLLNTIYAYRAGKWDLLLECIRKVIPYAFAYDHMNYARYLTVMLGDMLSLEEEFPVVYSQCISGNFDAQLSSNAFSRVEMDKVIKMTLNKDTKTPGMGNHRILDEYCCSQEMGDQCLLQSCFEISFPSTSQLPIPDSSSQRPDFCKNATR